jgi:DNA-binding MurR/RpiR family transcriptional regulator
MTKRRRPRTPVDPQQNAERLLKILTANLERATEPSLRERLRRAIAALKEKRQAA